MQFSFKQRNDLVQVSDRSLKHFPNEDFAAAMVLPQQICKPFRVDFRVGRYIFRRTTSLEASIRSTLASCRTGLAIFFNLRKHLSVLASTFEMHLERSKSTHVFTETKSCNGNILPDYQTICLSTHFYVGSCSKMKEAKYVNITGFRVAEEDWQASVWYK